MRIAASFHLRTARCGAESRWMYFPTASQPRSLDGGLASATTSRTKIYPMGGKVSASALYAKKIHLEDTPQFGRKSILRILFTDGSTWTEIPHLEGSCNKQGVKNLENGDKTGFQIKLETLEEHFEVKVSLLPLEITGIMSSENPAFVKGIFNNDDIAQADPYVGQATLVICFSCLGECIQKSPGL